HEGVSLAHRAAAANGDGQAVYLGRCWRRIGILPSPCPRLPGPSGRRGSGLQGALRPRTTGAGSSAWPYSARLAACRWGKCAGAGTWTGFGFHLVRFEWLAALGAGQERAEELAATPVTVLQWRSLLVGHMGIAPVHDGHHHRVEVLAF